MKVLLYSQQYQADTVNAVLDVFDGQPRAQRRFEIRPTAGAGCSGLNQELFSLS